MIANAIIASIKKKKRLHMQFIEESLSSLGQEIQDQIQPKIVCEIQERLTPWKILCALDLAGSKCSF